MLLRVFLRHWTRLACLLGAGSLALGCPSAREPDGPSMPLIPRIPLPGTALRGMSGLTAIPGTEPQEFLAVSERLHHVVPIQWTGSTFVTGTPVPVQGVPRQVDLEGIAWMDSESGASRLVFATEARTARHSDVLLEAERSGDAYHVRRQIPFDYPLWGLQPGSNRGLEGVCAVGRGTSARYVAVSEIVQTVNQHRRAPLGVYRVGDASWRPLWVKLTTDKGKLSGITCDETERGWTVTAIERHFGILRLLRFSMNDESDSELVPEPIADLRPGFDETPPNFEGLARLDAHRLLLLTDNDYGGLQGPTELIVFESAPPAAESSTRSRASVQP
ncbi:MAG: esterase-like activity of phytase family protein [Myxococcota bacterium]